MKPSLTSTKNYNLFFRSKTNRPVDLAHHKKLRESMAAYGWIQAYPMHVTRDDKKRLVIVDGQHRFELAKELGLSVWYVVTEDIADVATINNAQKCWNNSDYAGTFAQRGNADYMRLQVFAEQHRISASCAAALLSGTIVFHNVSEEFKNGTWKITDEAFAKSVCEIMSEFGKYGLKRLNRYFVDSIAACCRVKSFVPQRMIASVSRCPEKIMPYSTRDAILAMLEDIYNFGRSDKSRTPLKFEAEKAMRDRNPAGKTKNV